jgi:redox-sensitive bicupin YhaK (pirin superfamily)
MDGTTRKISKIIEPQAVVEGAGVRLKRSIGTHTLDYLDPFLLLDHFQSKNPADYQAGFPLHPHRGIETVTYLLAGAVRHRDSVGNAGEIGPGDLQWMTAGRGIMHEEMPQVRPEGVAGFQLWVNLPAKQKMIAPRYQNVNANEIAEIKREGGAKIRVIAGKVDGVVGPISGIAAEPMYLDVAVAPHGSFSLPIPRGHSVFAYVFEGEGKFGPEKRSVTTPRLVVWDDGDSVEVRTEESAVRFLLVSGKPLNEPIARYGPFVMNSKAEIEQTLRELQAGTFAQ